MKNILLKITGLYMLLACSLISCEDFVEEEPIDFLTPETAYTIIEDFEAALGDLYARVRDINYNPSGAHYAFVHLFGTDIFKDAREDPGRSGNVGDYAATITPTTTVVSWHWERWYKVISNANTILARSETADLDESDKNAIAAEARLFRAIAYRHLLYLYGGVPLVLEELEEPKADFTRATEGEVLAQMVEDLTFAASNLPSIAEVADGKLSNLVAQHYLAESYMSLGEWGQAIAAASVVIDDPATSLMQGRFGTRATEEPGDVYWDLFRRGNQNRSTGNTEAIWVAQMEIDVPGGMLSTAGIQGFPLERIHGPAILSFRDPNGDPASLGARSTINTSGRGVSFMDGTLHFNETIWASDFDNDIRNANHNIYRTHFYENPESEFFGLSVLENPSPQLEAQPWRVYPFVTKVTTPGNHPDLLFNDKDNLTLKNSAGSTYRDDYYIRVAETYLLRAEAYLGQGDVGSAAADINMVRARANANPVAAGDVTIDYILDERARELSFEEERRLTLSRVGKLVERVRLFNEWNGPQIQDFHELFPIPASEIEANINDNLTQNPGY